MKKIVFLFLFFITAQLYASMEITFDGVTLAPPVNWTIIRNEGQSPAITLISPNNQSTITLNISHYSGTELNVAGQKDNLQAELAKSMNNVIITGSGKDYIEYTADQEQVNYSFYQKYIIIDLRLFIFTYTATTDRYLDNRPLFLDLTNQFRTLNQRF